MKTCLNPTCPCREPVLAATCPQGRDWCHPNTPCMQVALDALTLAGWSLAPSDDAPAPLDRQAPDAASSQVAP